MKILLINPPLVLNKTIGQPVIFQPLGLAYIASALAQEHEVKVLDLNTEGWGHFKKCSFQEGQDSLINEFKEDILGFSAGLIGLTIPFSVNSPSTFHIAKVIKKMLPSVPIVVGGAHPSVRPYESLEPLDIDFVVMGEGEVTICQLAKYISQGNLNFGEIEGLGFKKNGKGHINKPRPPCSNLDDIFFPARHLLPMEKYFAIIKKQDLSRVDYVYHPRWTSMITSRGCPYQCNFCSIHLTMGRRFRSRSAGNVIQEIDELVERYQVQHINIEDDNFTFDKNRVHQICDHILEKKYNLSLSAPNGIRADKIDETLVKKMAQAGFKRVFVAPESGVQRVVRDIIGKNLDLKQIEEAVRLFRKYKITVDASFVIGFIGETKKEIWKTIWYAFRLKKLGAEKIGFHIATPLYGTRFYQEALEKGYLVKDLQDEILTPGNALIETPEFSREDIRNFQSLANWLVNYNFYQKILAVFRRIFKNRIERNSGL